MSLKRIKDEKIYKDAYITIFDKFDEEIANFDSIDELNKEWEDYKSTEPLIDDEKIRKALMAVYDAAPHRDNVVYFDGR